MFTVLWQGKWVAGICCCQCNEFETKTKISVITSPWHLRGETMTTCNSALLPLARYLWFVWMRVISVGSNIGPALCAAKNPLKMFVSNNGKHSLILNTESHSMNRVWSVFQYECCSRLYKRFGCSIETWFWNKFPPFPSIGGFDQKIKVYCESWHYVRCQIGFRPNSCLQCGIPWSTIVCGWHYSLNIQTGFNLVRKEFSILILSLTHPSCMFEQNLWHVSTNCTDQVI